MNVAVIGASNKVERYSYKVISLLVEKGYNVFPVAKINISSINDIKVYHNINDIDEPIDTITLYVNHEISDRLTDNIIAADPKRIIFNPGAENSKLADLASGKGIKVLNACTIVMLKTDQF